MQEQQQIKFLNKEEESGSQRSPTSSTSPKTGNEVIETGKKKKRSRTTFNSEQLISLERYFRKSHYVNRGRRIELANILALPEKQIKIWFQNRRMKHKKELELQSTRSAESRIERAPSYSLDTLNASRNSSYLATLDCENISCNQQEREQNYFQSVIESVASVQQIQSSCNVLQNDMFSPHNQYVSYQTDYSGTTCSQLQQDYNYQQQWNNYPNAQNNINFSGENSYMNGDDCAYNNVVQTQNNYNNNYTYNNNDTNSFFNENISAALQESVDTLYNYENYSLVENFLPGNALENQTS